MPKIQHAQFPQDLEAVIAIFREYIASASVSLAFQPGTSFLALDL